jgi:hypothetical protein
VRGSSRTGGELGVADRVLDVLVAEVVLDRARVLAVVGELEARRVAEHVRVDRHADGGGLAGTGHNLPKRGVGHRALAVGGENVGGVGLAALELAERAELRAVEGVGRRDPVLAAADVEEALAEIDLLPAQRDELADAEAVAESDEHHGRVAVAVRV